ncbi:MAG TPA: hypothetical protein VE910_04200, partial [Dongiaceae bacterium]|nr:hypothetical protein [Dongiaceae bacterium]
VQSPDLWWNLASGKWMLEHKAFLDHDVFTFTSPGIPWINRTWLWAVLFQIVFAAGGLAAICVVTSAMVTGVVAATAWTRRAGRHPIAFALLGLLVLSVAQIRFLHRPSLISDLLAPTTILLWLRWREGRSRVAAPIALAVIQILWTHLHGGFVLGLLIAGGFLVEAIVARRNWRIPALILGVGIASVLLTPWRNELLASLWGFVVRLAPALLGHSEVAVPEVARDAAGPAARNIVVEWLPTFSPMARRILGPFFMAYVALLGLTLVLVLRTVLGRVSPKLPGVPAWARADALILIALAVLSIVGLRFVGTLALGGFPLLWELLTENLDNHPVQVKRKKQPAAGKKNEPILGTAVVTLVMLLLTTSVVTNAYWKHFGARTRFGIGVMPYLFPEKLTGWMEQNHVEGRFWNGYEVGSYLDWRYGAVGRVFTDSRLVSDEVYREYLALMDSPAAWTQVAAKYQLQGAMLDKRDPDQVKLYRLLKPDPRSRVVYEDPRYVLVLTGVLGEN